MIRRLLSALFAAPSVGAAPAHRVPLPGLVPAPGTSAWHQRRAYRASAATHIAYGMWAAGHDCVNPVEIAEQAEQAAAEWALFSLMLRDEVASVDVPDTPEDLFGGEG